MKYPNLRYGSPDELRYYATGIPLADLARQLRRDERTVRDWLNSRRRVPFWVPELLRLRNEERTSQLRRMGISRGLHRIGLTNGKVITLRTATTPNHAHFRDTESFSAKTSPTGPAPTGNVRFADRYMIRKTAVTK